MSFFHEDMAKNTWDKVTKVCDVFVVQKQINHEERNNLFMANLSYDIAVFQCIASCHKNHMITHVLTLLREYVTSLTMSVTTM